MQKSEIIMEKMENRVQNYWTKRAKDFSTVRRNELKDPITQRWVGEIAAYLPGGKLNILDVGTGTGYFAILLSRMGHKVTGIDLTQAMLVQARETAAVYEVYPEFLQMDAQALDFESCSFDVVISRNLTWTLPDPVKAYKEWCRVLKPGGILLNFDADYATNVRNRNQSASYIPSTEIYGHCGITKELEQENAEITLAMAAAGLSRPHWDLEILAGLGFRETACRQNVGRQILKEHDLEDAPMFLVYAKK